MSIVSAFFGDANQRYVKSLQPTLQKINSLEEEISKLSSEKLKIKTSEKIEEKSKVAVVKKEMNTLPLVVEKCKKCGNDKAYFWTSQTRAGDEAETKFFKCTKCNHTWREYR